MKGQREVSREEAERVRREIDRIIGALMASNPFYAFMLSKLRLVVTRDVPTLATDSRAIYVNPDFFLSLNDMGRVFVLLHEVEHALRLHPYRLEKLAEVHRDYDPTVLAETANIAADALVNRDLADSLGIPPPGAAVTPELVKRLYGVDVGSKSMEEITHEILKKTAERRQNAGQGGGQPRQQRSGASSQQGSRSHASGRPCPGGATQGGASATPQPQGAPGGGAPRGQAPLQAGPAGAGGGQARQQQAAAGGSGSGRRGRAGEEGDYRDKDIIGRDLIKPGSKKPRGVVVKEGDEELQRELERAERELEKGGGIERALEKARKAMGRAAAESYAAAKLAGRVPGHLRRVVDSLLETKTDWRRILKKLIDEALGSRVRKTWSRINRKKPWSLPGKKLYGDIRRAFVLVDVSGSIGGKELARMLSEVYTMLRKHVREVVLVPWDVGAKGVYKVRSPAELRKIAAQGVAGGGGTVLSPAIRAILRDVDKRDAVIIMSDWVLSDPGDSARLIEELSKRSGAVVLVSTSAEPPPVRARNVKKAKIEVEA